MTQDEGSRGDGRLDRHKPRKSRGRGLRTRTGCITCRRRHLKCDERRPTCRACARGEHTCIYPEQTENVSATTPGHVPESAPSESQPDEVSHSTSSSEGHPATQSKSPDPQPSRLVPPQRGSMNQDHNVLAEHVSPSTYVETSSRMRLANIVEGQLVEDSTTEVTHAPDLHSPSLARDAFSSEQSNPRASVLPSISTISFQYGSPDDQPAVSHPNTGPRPDIAVSNWFNLLAGDAELSNVHLPSPSSGARPIDYNKAQPSIEDQHELRPHHMALHGQANDQIENSALSDLSPHTDVIMTDDSSWRSAQSPDLKPAEKLLFNHFISTISQWMDLFDPLKYHGISVPHLALHNAGLLNALLALAARHLSLLRTTSEHHVYSRNDAVQYYHNTLHYVQTAMRHSSYQTSEEILATCLIVSAYEMLDGSSKDWERHLKEVFWLQRSQINHDDFKGLKQSTRWAWLCQDIWAAFRERRKPFVFWRPAGEYNSLNDFELAARAVYLTAQVVAYCSQEEIDKGERDIQTRMNEAEELSGMLDLWERSLTTRFEPLPYVEISGLRQAFEPIWINPSAFSVAVQLLHASRILLSLYRPSFRGFEAFLTQQKAIEVHVNTICGLAKTSTDYASSIMSSQCLYIAGLSVRDPLQREEISELLRACHARAGWPIQPLSMDLEKIWNGSISDLR